VVIGTQSQPIITVELPTLTGYNKDAYKVEVRSELQTKLVTPDSNGKWSFKLEKPLENGIHNIKVYDRNNKVLSDSNFTVAVAPAGISWVYIAGAIMLLGILFVVVGKFAKKKLTVPTQRYF